MNIKEEAPYLVIGSPPFTLFSMLQELSIAQHGGDPNWMAKFRVRLEQAKTHIRFLPHHILVPIEQRQTLPARTSVDSTIMGYGRTTTTSCAPRSTASAGTHVQLWYDSAGRRTTQPTLTSQEAHGFPYQQHVYRTRTREEVHRRPQARTLNQRQGCCSASIPDSAV